MKIKALLVASALAATSFVAQAETLFVFATNQPAAQQQLIQRAAAEGKTIGSIYCFNYSSNLVECRANVIN